LLIAEKYDHVFEKPRSAFKAILLNLK